MASILYEFNKNDTLIKIANIFNTNVKTLVRLNSWLKDDRGKTLLKPNNVLKTQDISEEFLYESIKAYNLLFNDIILIYTETSPKKGSIELTVTYFDGTIRELLQNNTGDFVISGTSQIFDKFSRFNYNLNFFTIDLSEAKLISHIKIKYKPVYIVVPIIGTGDSTVEDYIAHLSNTLGFNYQIAADNLVSKRLSPKINSISGYSGDDLATYLDNVAGYLNIKTLDLFDSNIVESNGLGGIRDLPTNKTIISGITTYDLVNLDTHSNYESKLVSFMTILDQIKKYLGTKTIIGKSNIANVTASHSSTAIGKCIVTVGDTVLYMPCFPDSVSDGTNANYSTTDVLGRSEPFLVYNNTSGRELSFTFNMHREMWGSGSEGVIEHIVRVIESGVYPNYGSKIAPQKVTVRIGSQIYIEGVMKSEHTTWSGPIDFSGGAGYGKYNMVTIEFTVAESTNSPKSSSYIRAKGGFRN